MPNNPLFKWKVAEDLYVMNWRNKPETTLATIRKTPNENGKFRVHFWTAKDKVTEPYKFWADDITTGQAIVELLFANMPAEKPT